MGNLSIISINQIFSQFTIEMSKSFFKQQKKQPTLLHQKIAIKNSRNFFSEVFRTKVI